MVIWLSYVPATGVITHRGRSDLMESAVAKIATLPPDEYFLILDDVDADIDLATLADTHSVIDGELVLKPNGA